MKSTEDLNWETDCGKIYVNFLKENFNLLIIFFKFKTRLEVI